MDKFNGLLSPEAKTTKRQYKRFSWTMILKDTLKGYRLLWTESNEMLLGAFKKNTKVLRRQPIKADIGCIQVNLDSDNEPIGASYGFSQYSKLLAVITLWIPAFVLDARPGVYVSDFFAVVSYIATTLSLFAGLFVTGFMIEPLFRTSVSNFTDMFADILTIGILSGLATYIFLAFITLIWIVKQREFLQDFILQHCSKFRVAKNFQRRQITKIFVITMLTIILGDPLLAVTLTYSNLTYGKGYMDGFSETSFYSIKTTMLAVFAWGAFVLYSLANVIPIMSNFLIVTVSKHVKTNLEMQLDRRKCIKLDNRVHNPDLLSMVQDFERKIIDELACDTITMDWPDIVQAESYSPSRSANSNYLSSTSSSLTPLSYSSGTMTPEKPLLRQSRRISRTDLIVKNNRALAASGLLFTYKNLIKLLSELKSLIRSYESKFGGFHLAQIYLSGFVTAQWIVSGLAEARSTRADYLRHHNTEPNWTAYTTLLVVRAVISLALFVISNIVIFLRSDQLPQQMMKLRSKLFKINLELAREAMAVQRAEWSQQGDQRRSSNFMIASGETVKSQNTVSVECPELDQAWSLYDQVARMSHRVNFKLGNNLYYNKNCLLKLIGREISLILLYVQLIDIYSNSVW